MLDGTEEGSDAMAKAFKPYIFYNKKSDSNIAKLNFTSNICKAFGEVLGNLPFDHILKAFCMIGKGLLEFIDTLH